MTSREESVGVSGQVTIAVTPEFGSLVALTLFPIARERHPHLTFVMRPAYEFEDMQDPGTDIAFRIGTFRDDRLVARKLGAFRRCLVASPDLANACRIARPEDLTDAPCLTAHGDRLGATWTLNSPKGDTAVEVTGPIAVQSFAILFELAVAGQGYAFLPDFMLGNALENGALVRCLPDYGSRPLPVFLTFRPGARRVARIDAAVAFAEELIPDLLSE